MRRVLILCLLLCVAACKKPGTSTAPDLSTRLPPGLESTFWQPLGWAWGALKVGDRPYLRYGVSAAPAIPLGHIVILTGYGESAEQWFETARALNDADYTVWVLEGAGQGGSGRYAQPHDLGHLPDFDNDQRGFQALIRHVIRPPKGQRVIVVASGTAWMPTVAAFEQGAEASKLILSYPIEPPYPSASPTKTARAKGGAAWTRPDLTGLSRRERAAKSWAIANPDLRMGGQSWGWYEARTRLSGQIQAEAVARIKIPILILDPGDNFLNCLKLPRCTDHRLAADAPYQQSPDVDRQPWIEALIAGLAPDHAP